MSSNNGIYLTRNPDRMYHTYPTKPVPFTGLSKVGLAGFLFILTLLIVTAFFAPDLRDAPLWGQLLFIVPLGALTYWVSLLAP